MPIGGTKAKTPHKQRGFYFTMKVDTQRAKTMRERLGEASELIDTDQYLPMYRNRQIHYPELFEFSIKLAKRKDNPKGYFANIWKPENLKKTIDWIAKLMNMAKSKAMDIVRELQQRRETAKAERERRKNADNLAKLDKLKVGMFRPGYSPMKA